MAELSCDVCRKFIGLILVICGIFYFTAASYAPSPYDCDFETGATPTCSWTQDTTDQFDWSLNQGETSSSDTGPTFDHSLQNQNGHYVYIEATGLLPNDNARLLSQSVPLATGHYVYIETSDPRLRNDTARLLSQSVPLATDGKCLKFWYHMYGYDIYKLNVYAKLASNLGSVLWSKIGAQGNEWRYTSVYITPETLTPPQQGIVNVNFVIEGIRGNDYGGDIAIDDVTVNDGPCPPTNSSVAIGKNANLTDGFSASLAVDGLTDTCSQTASIAAEWTLDLTENYQIERVSIYAEHEAKSYKIEMGLALGKYEADNIMNTSTSSAATWRPASNGPYRHVRIQANPKTQPLKLCELQITGSPQPRTPQFRVFTGIAMSNPPVRTVSSVCQIECSSICLGQTKPACVTAQFDQSRKSCALFDGFEHVKSPTNANKTVVFAFAAHIFTK